MQKAIFSLYLLFIIVLCNAQTSDTTYYNNVYLQKEVQPNKAKFARIVTTQADGLSTVLVKDLSSQKTISSSSFKDSEPMGIWLKQKNGELVELDYDFDVVYRKIPCADSLSAIKDIFSDDTAANYIAPKLATGEKSIYSFLGNNTVYPRFARDNALEGNVYVVFTISASGTTTNVEVLRGIHISLDKEAVRVIKLMKFSNPPTLNGVARSCCAVIPLKFSLS